MKNNKAWYYVAIAAVVVGFFIMSNYNEDATSSTQLTASEYKSMLDEKNDLVKQVSNLKEENTNMESLVRKYEASENNAEVVDTMKQQLKDYEMLSGSNEVQGPGIVIKVKDGKYSSSDAYADKMSKILHDSDAECLINDIRNAGAEAISLNDHRIIGSSAVRCKWAFLALDDGSEAYPDPYFNFYAIGDPDSLEAELKKEGSYFNKLLIRGLDISIEKKDEIKLKASDVIEMKYAKEYTKK